MYRNYNYRPRMSPQSRPRQSRPPRLAPPNKQQPPRRQPAAPVSPPFNMNGIKEQLFSSFAAQNPMLSLLLNGKGDMNSLLSMLLRGNFRM